MVLPRSFRRSATVAAMLLSSVIVVSVSPTVLLGQIASGGANLKYSLYEVQMFTHLGIDEVARHSAIKHRGYFFAVAPGS